MNKKGLIHVDWAISMGIFIVYILGMFIFLRPGVTPIHKPEALLDSVEENLKDSIYWTVKKTPLYVDNCMAGGVFEPCNIQVSADGWSFSKSEGSDGETYDTGSILRFSLSCTGEADGKEITDPDVIIDLTYYLDPLVEETIPRNVLANLQLEVSDFPQCKAHLMATENMMGISSGLRDSLKAKSFEEVVGSDMWAFPAEKSLAVYTYTSATVSDRLNWDRIVWKQEPGAEQNIFIREWKDRIVNEDGSNEPLTIHIEIW